jgi:hypothetical protein
LVIHLAKQLSLDDYEFCQFPELLSMLETAYPDVLYAIRRSSIRTFYGQAYNRRDMGWVLGIMKFGTDCAIHDEFLASLVFRKRVQLHPGDLRAFLLQDCFHSVRATRADDTALVLQRLTPACSE